MCPIYVWIEDCKGNKKKLPSNHIYFDWTGILCYLSKKTLSSNCWEIIMSGVLIKIAAKRAKESNLIMAKDDLHHIFVLVWSRIFLFHAGLGEQVNFWLIFAPWKCTAGKFSSPTGLWRLDVPKLRTYLYVEVYCCFTYQDISL